MNQTELFFVECVKKGIKSEKINSIPSGLDYRQFYKLCATHSMTVVVFRVLENVKDKLLPQFFEALRHSATRHVMYDVQGQHDVDILLTAFEERGIKYMPLKGYHLKKLYPSTDMRYTSDFDILIDVNQLDKVRATVKDLKLATKRHDEHHDIVYYPHTRTIFELHKTIFVGPLENYFGVGNKGFDRATVKDGYKYFYQMDREIFYISLLAHSAYHFAESAGVGIRHLTDIYLYRKEYNLDEKYLNSELEKCGLLKFKEEFEKLSAFFFEDASADEFTKKLGKHILESSLFSNDDKKFASVVASQSSSDKSENNSAKNRAFWKKIFPIKEHMKFSYPILKKHGWLLPIFYVVRWFHVLFTRPQNIKELKNIKSVESDKLLHMQEIRNGLDINNL